MKDTERWSLALLVALLLAALALTPLTSDRSYLGLAAVLAGSSIGLGAIARRWRAPAVVVGLAQVTPGAVLLLFYLPRLPRLAAETARFVATSVAPMTHHLGVALFSAWLLWVLYLVLDSLAIGLQRPGWVFPVLLLPSLITALIVPQRFHPIWFFLIGLGYVGVLATDTYHALLSQAGSSSSRPIRRGVVVATLLTAMLALLGSLVGFGLLPDRNGTGLNPGQGNGGVQLGDPSLDLIRNLRSPTDRVVITYRSEEPRYLRMAALSAFDANGFHLVATDLLGLPVAAPAGVAASQRTFETSIAVGDLSSEWLPVPWVPKQASTDGDWRYDPRTNAVVAVGPNRKQATRNLRYTVTSWDLEPSRAAIAAAPAGDPRDGGLTLQLPSELNPQLTALAEKIVEDADTDGERALALTDWLASDAFAYSLAGQPGTTLETLDDFLLTSRSGYCEQFAGSLATLTRTLGIPSRVVIGFLPGARTDDGFEVSLRQSHAWTELYLDGLGWVPFDATPSGATGVTPSPIAPDSSPSDLPTVSPSEESPAPLEPADPDGSNGTTLPLAWVGFTVAALLAALAPLTVRTGRRWLRLRPGRDPAVMVEDAWDEARDTVVDTGLDWPRGTPRQVAAELGERLDIDAASALGELAVLVEQARFASQPVGPAGVTVLVGRIRGGLRASRGGRHHPVRRLLPRSVMQWNSVVRWNGRGRRLGR